ncbi:S8 family serine peptidase [Ahniella affigens]|nr:S8 family serine peptidase [Ahniella affigens]
MILSRDSAAADVAKSAGSWAEDYGSFIVVGVDQGQAKALTSGNHGVLLDGHIYTRGRSFDPLVDNLRAKTSNPRAYKESLNSSGEDFIVQFSAPVRDEWLQDLRMAGLTVVNYLPTDAFLVHGKPDQVMALVSHPRIRWVGAYEPIDRLGPALDYVFADAETMQKRTFNAPPPKSVSRYEIAFAKYTTMMEVLSSVGTLGGQVRQYMDLPNSYFDLVRVDLPAEKLADVARLKGVISIDPYIAPTAEDERAAQIVAGNFVNATTVSPPGYDPLTQFTVDGTSVTVAIVDDGIGIPGDGGFYVTAANAVNANLRGAAAGADGHGHLQASIIAGTTPFSTLDPGGYNYGLGVAPKAHVINIPLLRTGYGGSEADTANDAVTTAGPNGVLGTISNNSWGAGTNSNAYDSLAAAYDGFVRDASAGSSIDELMVVFSAGNSGPTANSLTRPKVAKNVLTVAASENVRPTSPSSTGSTSPADNLEQLPDFSSRGPAADQRIKPDIAAPGDAITGGRSGPDVLFGNIDTFHRISSGTSHAAPQIAGAAALFSEYWKDRNAGDSPSPALIKAALINGTVDMSGTGATAAIPNGNEGWGRVNLKNVMNDIVTEYVDQSVPLQTPGEEYTFNGAIADGGKDLRIALVWTDPPGTVDPALVNNLDLEVTLNGTLYRGNVFTAGVSATGGAANTRDNVERVYLPVGSSGLSSGATLQVKVRATGLNGDGILGGADTTDQHFALVCSNCVAEPGFALTTSPTNASVCAGTNVSQSLDVSPILGFNAPVDLTATGLPAPGTVNFTPSTIAALPGSALLQIGSAGVGTGDYAIALTGTSGVVVRNTNFNLHVSSAVPATPTLTAPADTAVGVPTSPVLTWAVVPDAASYTVEIATDVNFSNIVDSETVTGNSYAVTPALNTQTTYYWRVRATNACGSSVLSSVRSFATEALVCFTGSLSIPDNTPAGVSSNIVIPAGGPAISGLKLRVEVTHTYIGDLVISLAKNGGAAVNVINRPLRASGSGSCNVANIAANFLMSSSTTSGTCAASPPAFGGDVQPIATFVPFDGASEGTWTLKIVDAANLDVGTLTRWCIDLPGPSQPTDILFKNDFE